MSIHVQPLPEVSSRAKSILIQELGVIDTLRFLNQLRTGSGDYAADREQLFKGESVESIAAEIKRRRSGLV